MTIHLIPHGKSHNPNTPYGPVCGARSIPIKRCTTDPHKVTCQQCKQQQPERSKMKTKRLYFDIETIPNEHFRTDPPAKPDVEAKPVPSNIKDPKKIAERAAENQLKAEREAEDNYEKALADHEKHFRDYAMYAFKSRIVSIAWAWDDEECKVSCSRDEKAILVAFFTDIAAHLGMLSFQWAGHNVKQFDLPMLQARAMMNQCMPRKFDIPWRERPWNHDKVFDTMDEIPYIKDGKSLRWILNVLGLEAKLMSGADVYDAYCCGNIESIKAYNIGDVEAVRNICKTLAI